jgi:hypothetical protein
MPEQEPAQPGALVVTTGAAPAEPGAVPLATGGLPEATVVHYHLPVEIEVRAAPAAIDADAVAKKALLGLTRGLANT